LAALKACRSIIDSSIAEHNGRIFGGAGDSVVAEFASPIQAVLCATEFQRLLADRNAHFGDKGTMKFRVRVNMGDVIIDGNDLYGDGVNVAARLDALAEAAGICESVATGGHRSPAKKVHIVIFCAPTPHGSAKEMEAARDREKPPMGRHFRAAVRHAFHRFGAGV
jgi:class 3 adenylate cyclase